MNKQFCILVSFVALCCYGSFGNAMRDGFSEDSNSSEKRYLELENSRGVKEFIYHR